MGPVDKDWSSEAGGRLIAFTRDLETDEAMVVECVPGEAEAAEVAGKQGRWSGVT